MKKLSGSNTGEANGEIIMANGGKKLSENIERVSTGSSEGGTVNETLSEEDLLEYTAAFIREFSEIPPLEHFSLLNPGEARKAAEMLEEKRRYLDRKLRAAATLKEMLERRSVRLKLS